MKSLFETSQLLTTETTVSKPRPDSLEQAQQLLRNSMNLREKPGNCFIITGMWKRDTRYELHLRITNPPAPVLDEKEHSLPAPRVWLAPLKYGKSSTGQLTIRVNGASKYGAMCTIPAALNASISRSFDACKIAHDAGQVVANQKDVNVCLDALRAMKVASKGTLSAVYPFNAPPLASRSDIYAKQDADNVCVTGTIKSSRPRGECVSCAWGVVVDTIQSSKEIGATSTNKTSSLDGGSTCQCDPSSYRLHVGTSACHEPLVIGFTTTTLDSLPASICKYFVQVCASIRG